MPICLWKDCEFESEDMAAFQAHVITKHSALQQLQQQAQLQQQQLNLDNQNDGTEEPDQGETMAIKARMNEEEGNKMANRGGQRIIILMAVEVWVDVLGFVKRIQLARSVCLVNWKIYEICWPRLHGNKVVAYHVRNIIIGYCYESGHPPTALLLNDFKKVPFPECPPPDYISGFGHIQIKFLDHQVLSFLSLIAPCITKKQVRIEFIKKMTDLDENQIASLNQLLQLFREKITTIHSILFHRCLSNIQFMPDVDNQVKGIDCCGLQEEDIPSLIAFLASPRSDGRQRVMVMYLSSRELPAAQKMLDAIKEEFRTSIQLMPQPFCLFLRANLNIPQSEEENLQSDETLTIMQNPGNRNFFEICRHPRGQHEQWAEDARKRLIELPIDNLITRIHVDISEFGMPYCSP